MKACTPDILFDLDTADRTHHESGVVILSADSSTHASSDAAAACFLRSNHGISSSQKARHGLMQAKSGRLLHDLKRCSLS